MKIDLIRRAIIKHRGGLEDATDSQIKQIWDSLSRDTQEQYLQTLEKGRSKKDAVSNTSRRNIRSSSKH